jgi:acyl-CoA reductase-like NAD-dependent aldehyde dehydrogenase
MNSGQACAAGTRLLVPKSRFDQVKRAIVEAMAAFPVGDPADPKTAVGPMVSQKQYEQVQSYIRKGIEEGAEVLVGGEGHPKGFEGGYFVKPTVFVNVKNDMTIAQEEIFGPVPLSSLMTPRTRRSGSPTTLIWSPRRRPWDRPPARASRGFADTGRARRDQQHDG